MGKRSTVYNEGLTSNWDNVLKKNQQLLKEFILYCKTTDHSAQTCYQYEQQLRVFFCWIEKNCDNKFFVDIKKREYIMFFGSLQEEYGMSSNRIATIKSVISSLSNYVENILDEEYPTFKNAVKNIQLGVKQPVREKTVMTEEQVQEGLDKLVELGKYEIACFFAALVSSGARKAEVLQYKVSDFTDKNVVLHGKYWLTAPIRTKGRGVKGKILRKYVEIARFKPYLDLWLEKREELGIHNEELFTTYNNGEYGPAKISTVSSWAKVIGKVCGCDYYVHQSRHQFTTNAKRNGMPDSVLQKMVGWSSADMIQVYDDREDTEELEDYFKDDD